MNQKNSLGLDICFKDLDNPLDLFKIWMNEAIKSEPNDPNALSLATSSINGTPSIRMVLLKDYSKKGFTFYTNLKSQKSEEIKINPKASMCFHWKSLLRQIRISGSIDKVSNEEADIYFASRSYGSRIGAWASNQSHILNNRSELFDQIEKFKTKFPKQKNLPRPEYWSGWILKPNEIEFWKDGNDRIHERLKYIKNKNNSWERILLNP